MSMFPIRCVVECVSEGDCVKCIDHGTTVADSFAIVAGQTPLSQLVETVLSALGFQHLAVGAKGEDLGRDLSSGWKKLEVFWRFSMDPSQELETTKFRADHG